MRARSSAGPTGDAARAQTRSLVQAQPLTRLRVRAPPWIRARVRAPARTRPRARVRVRVQAPARLPVRGARSDPSGRSWQGGHPISHADDGCRARRSGWDALRARPVTPMFDQPGVSGTRTTRRFGSSPIDWVATPG